MLPEQSAAVAAMCSQVLATREVVRYEANFKGRDFVVTLFAMGSNAVVSSALDVTERKRTMAQLRENEQRLRQLLTLLPVASETIKAPSGEITYFNEQAATLWGRRPARRHGRALLRIFSALDALRFPSSA